MAPVSINLSAFNRPWRKEVGNSRTSGDRPESMVPSK
jgi:hypothetical protein